MSNKASAIFVILVILINVYQVQYTQSISLFGFSENFSVKPKDVTKEDYTRPRALFEDFPSFFRKIRKNSCLNLLPSF